MDIFYLSVLYLKLTVTVIISDIFLFLLLIILIMLLRRKKALVKHLEDEDVDAFTEEVKNFDQVSRLDQWYTTILLRIKKQIPDDGELC